MPIPTEAFVRYLTDSGLMSGAMLEGLLDEVSAAQRPRDGAALARWMVTHGYLTPYQAMQVYKGHVDRLVFENYVILDVLGAGGMGRVFKAEHRRMKRTVALKLLPDEVADDPAQVARFQREVQAAARLMHPNIVTAFDAGEANGVCFLVMEYVPGRDLASLVRVHGPLPVHQAVACVLDAARGLEYAHRHGVTHRDIKPANLLLSSESHGGAAGQPGSHTGTVKILDLGVARIDGTASEVATQTELTGTGVVMGTVDYMAPEQALATRNADHRSDIYSLGITLYYLLSGKPAYPGDSTMQRFVGHREGKIPSLRDVRETVPDGLDAIFTRMVAKRPEDRFQSMSDVVAALENVQAGMGQPPPSDLTSVAVACDAGSDWRGFLQAIAVRPAEQNAVPVIDATPTDARNGQSETEVSSASEQPVELATTMRPGDIIQQPIQKRRWLWWMGAGVLGLMLIAFWWKWAPSNVPGGAVASRTSVRVETSRDTVFSGDRFALSFDVPDAVVLVPLLPLNLRRPFAWEAWCRPGQATQGSQVGRFVGQLGPVQLKVWQDRWQSPIVDVAEGGSSGVFLESDPHSVTLDRVHVAFQWDGIQPRLFINGTPVAGQLRCFNHDGPADDYLEQLFVSDTPVSLRIGNFEHGDAGTHDESGVFMGQIDSLRVSRGLRYLDAFAPADLLADPQTVALYDFHEGAGDVLHDVSGQGHDGTIRGAVWIRRSAD